MNGLFRGSVRVTAIAGAGVLLASLVGACGAGQVTQTGTKLSAIGGVNATHGDIAIRDAYLVASDDEAWNAGSNAPLSLRIVNQGTRGDRLMSVSSSIATAGVQLAPAELEIDEPEPAPKNQPANSASPNATPSPSPSASPSASASPSTAASNGATGTQADSSKPADITKPADGAKPKPPTSPKEPVTWQPVALQPHVLVILTPKTTGANESDSAQWTSQIVLRGLKTQLRAGQKVTLTLTFEHAGKITLKLPVSVPAKPRARETPVKSEGHGHGEH